MSKGKLISIIFLLIFSLSSCKDTRTTKLGYSYAKKELELALSDKKQHNVMKLKEKVIKDKKTAIQIAEAILFEIYVKENILEQKPYEVYHIGSYWVILGTLPKGMLGGTFLIILNDKNAEVIKLSHGK